MNREWLAIALSTKELKGERKKNHSLLFLTPHSLWSLILFLSCVNYGKIPLCPFLISYVCLILFNCYLIIFLCSHKIFLKSIMQVFFSFLETLVIKTSTVLCSHQFCLSTGKVDMIQSLKCLPRKCEDLSCIPRTRVRKLGVVACAYNSIMGEMETSGFLGLTGQSD